MTIDLELPPPKPRKPPKAPRPRWRTILIVALVALLSIPVLSLGRALLTPNSLSISERGAEWMRDNNLGFILNRVESLSLIHI